MPLNILQFQDSSYNKELHGSNVNNAKFKKPSFIGKLIGVFVFFFFSSPTQKY